ncbi:MAG: tRNA uracil 4-sulfurtransferase ThiI [Clostridia bacterium]
MINNISVNNIVIVRYSEIHLKGNNRKFFENALIVNLKAAVNVFNCTVVKTSGRYIIKGYEEKDEQRIVDAVRCVFGVYSLSVGREINTYDDNDSNTDQILTRITETAKLFCPQDETTFKVECNRADKRFPLTSPLIAAEIGGKLIDLYNKLTVDLYHPKHIVYVDIRETGNTLIYSDIIRAVNGMPVGTGGKAIALLSGGIDSPVAIYMMAKRGMLIKALHFHSFPYTSNKAKDKVVELAKIVNKYALHLKLDVVSVTEIQTQIHEKCPEEMMITILRRFMMKIAQIIAEKNGCQAIITGESLGQVASQTIESLTVTNAAVSLPILRPLIAFDKDEIVEVAKKIGTFETSIQPFEDCCTVFLPKNPIIKPKLRNVERAEKALDIDGLIARALESIETITIE